MPKSAQLHHGITSIAQEATLHPLDATISEVTKRRLARLRHQDDEFMAKAEAEAEKACKKSAPKRTREASKYQLTQIAVTCDVMCCPLPPLQMLLACCCLQRPQPDMMMSHERMHACMHACMEPHWQQRSQSTE